MSNSICLSPHGSYLRREALSSAAGILPGLLIQRAAGEVAVFATADVKPAVLRVADLSVGDAGDVTREYADGETVNYVEGMSGGTYVTLRVAASQTIAIDGELASNGDGYVKSPAVAGTGVIFIADEAVTTGAGEEAFIRAIVASY